MMVCHISFDESYGIGTDCLVTVEISVVDNSRNLNASFFQSIERKDGMVYGAKSPVGHKYRRIIMFGDVIDCEIVVVDRNHEPASTFNKDAVVILSKLDRKSVV